MKKYLLSLLAVAALVFTACNKDPQPNKPDKPDTPDNPEPEYVAPITIDGDFADWAKIDASKLVTATCAADAAKTALKVAKVYADAVAVYIYIEFDAAQISWEQDVEHVPFHLYVDADGSATTGGFNDEQWSNGAFDALFEGSLTDGNQLVSYDPGVYAWNGGVGEKAWAWDVDNPLAESGVCTGAGKGNAYEIQMLRDLYPGDLADPFVLGIDIQQGWSTVGYLPNAGAEEGLVPGLTIKANK